MNVSFTGIKNANCTHIINTTPLSYATEKGTVYIPKSRDLVLNAQLTNIDESDLDDFKEILKKYPSPINKDVISFAYEFVEPSPKNIKSKYYLNGHHLEINDKNLWIFSKLSKLTEKMQDMSKLTNDKDFEQTRTFYEMMYFILQKFYKYTTNLPFSEIKKYAFNKLNVTNVAKSMQQQIQNDMLDYFS